MRTAFVAVSVLCLGLAWLGAGCVFNDTYCQSVNNDAPYCHGQGGNGATGSTGTMPTSSTGIPSDCVPTEGQSIAATCGVFVKANATGDGTEASPLGSVAQATQSAKLAATSRIYICGGDTFAGSVTITSGTSIYGGLDCSSWTYQAANAHPKLQSAPNVPGLSVASGSAKSFLEGIDIESVNATDPGASSIAIFADGAVVDMTNVALTAGNGAKGGDGADGGAQTASAPGGAVGANACAMPPAGGAASAVNTCDDGMSNGGKGGDGGLKTNGNGLNGDGGDVNTVANLGVGETALPSWNCNAGNGGGGVGTSGTDGPTGTGALLSAYGSLSGSGYTNAPGEDGTKGPKGQGGGGGGGSKATAACNGAGGGSGGAGGCGGKPGLGGVGGGSSLGIVSKGATLTLTTTTVSLGHGGNGGKGGNGQLGQDGGTAGGGGASGSGVVKACGGGDGGHGGNGGSAGGGRGGHAIGIVYSGAAPQGALTVTAAGGAGSGGIGGTNGLDQATSGADGSASAMQQVPAQ